MDHYQNRDDEECISSNEPSSSHHTEPKALKRTADSMNKFANKQHKKYKIDQLNNASNMYIHSSKILSHTNRNIVQTEKDFKSNDLVAVALQSIMSKMGKIVKENVPNEGDKRKFVKKKLYDLIYRRILGMPTAKTANHHKEIVAQYYEKYLPFWNDEDVMRILKGEELCSDVPQNYNNENIVNVPILPQPDKISQIFESRLEEGLAVNMLGMIKNIGNYYQNERDILQCIDELPDMNYLSDKEESSEVEENIKSEVKMTNAKLIGNEDSQNKISEAEKSILNEYYKIMDDILTPRILQYLNKYKPEFEQILNNDKDYVEAKSKIMIELSNKIEDSLDDTDDDVEIISVDDDVISINSDSDDEEINNVKDTKNIPEPNTESQNEAIQTDTEVSYVSTTPEDNRLLVKLISNPKLPPKKIMRTFLKKFNPAFVKKHKAVDNVLLIGFNNKQDHSNILGANKSNVGNSTIMIIQKVKQNTNNNKTDKNNDTSKEIVEDAVSQLTIESNATDKKEETVIDSPERTENKRELDEIVVIDDDDDDDDVLLLQDNTIMTFEGDTEKKVKEVDKKFTDAIKVKNIKSKNQIKVSSVINTTPSQTKIKYLTMLIGRPTLPEKVFVEEFLSRFNPVSIKRHKVVNNVLLVGLNNRKDYDNILAANESKVGSSIFIIRHKDVNSPNKQYNNSLPKDDSGEITAEKMKSEDLGNIVNSEYKVEGIKNNEVKKKINVMNVDSCITENNLNKCTDSKREQILCGQQEDLKTSESDEEKSYLEANVGDMMNKKISETISKVGQINKQTGCESSKREKLEGKNGADPETNEDEAINQMVDETFFKKLHLLEEHLVSLLRQDKEYNAVKTVILKNVESMKKGKESRDESDSDYENKNRLTNSKDNDRISKDGDEILIDNILEKNIAKPSNADSLNFKDGITSIKGNISAAKDVIVEHDDSKKVQDNSKIPNATNTNLNGTKLYMSEQNNLNALNSIPDVDKNDNIQKNLKETERLDSIEIKSNDEKIDMKNKDKQTNVNEVRLLSLPKLPSNELLRDFLSKYHIRYRKRHKNHSNLLVIGLADETHYHSILAMDGTSIGDVKLVIRPSVT